MDCYCTVHNSVDNCTVLSRANNCLPKQSHSNSSMPPASWLSIWFFLDFIILFWLLTLNNTYIDIDIDIQYWYWYTLHWHWYYIDIDIHLLPLGKFVEMSSQPHTSFCLKFYQKLSKSVNYYHFIVYILKIPIYVSLHIYEVYTLHVFKKLSFSSNFVCNRYVTLQILSIGEFMNSIMCLF